MRHTWKPKSLCRPLKLQKIWSVTKRKSKRTCEVKHKHCINYAQLVAKKRYLLRLGCDCAIQRKHCALFAQSGTRFGLRMSAWAVQLRKGLKNCLNEISFLAWRYLLDCWDEPHSILSVNLRFHWFPAVAFWLQVRFLVETESLLVPFFSKPLTTRDAGPFTCLRSFIIALRLLFFCLKVAGVFYSGAKKRVRRKTWNYLFQKQYCQSLVLFRFMCSPFTSTRILCSDTDSGSPTPSYGSKGTAMCPYEYSVLVKQPRVVDVIMYCSRRFVFTVTTILLLK